LGPVKAPPLYAPALPANISLGQKCLTVTNALAFYYAEENMYVKSFILQAHALHNSLSKFSRKSQNTI